MIGHFKTVHPFPARMAPSIVWDRLPEDKNPIRLLDPMSGSGTTVTVARSKGHIAYGVDRDPLAITISRAWCSNLNKNELLGKAEQVLDRAKVTVKTLKTQTAYPRNADIETKKFIKFWFDLKNRKQLTALSQHISSVHSESLRHFLWTAFSRMIITKKVGVSLGMDISHSRPHKVYEKAPIDAFSVFMKQVSRVIKANPFSDESKKYPEATVLYGDSRQLPFESNYFDYIITSPPYLNAIDYLRGHKLSLVWMKNSIENIRNLRATNIGAELKSEIPREGHLKEALNAAGEYTSLNDRQQGFLVRYIKDMDSVCTEVYRVLKNRGKAIFVVGDSTINKVFISNSKIITCLFKHHGLYLNNREERPLQANKRYLPPPTKRSAGHQLRTRMRQEVILTLIKNESTDNGS